MERRNMDVTELGKKIVNYSICALLVILGITVFCTLAEGLIGFAQTTVGAIIITIVLLKLLINYTKNH